MKKYGRVGRGFRATTVADADLWTKMRRYHQEWGGADKGLLGEGPRGERREADG